MERKVKTNLDIDRAIGRKIYIGALSHRRGFRSDQIGIEDDEIWDEIYEALGKVARTVIPYEAGKLNVLEQAVIDANIELYEFLRNKPTAPFEDSRVPSTRLNYAVAELVAALEAKKDNDASTNSNS